MHKIKAAILFYQSSLERQNFVNLNETHLFLLLIKKKKPFAIPTACTRWKTERGIGIIFFRADNYAVATENSEEILYKASIGKPHGSHYQRIMSLPRRMTVNVSDAM